MNESTEISMQELKESTYKFELNVQDLSLEDFDRKASMLPSPLLVKQDEPYVESEDPNKPFLNDDARPCLVMYLNVKGQKPLYLSGHYSSRGFLNLANIIDPDIKTLRDINDSIKDNRKRVLYKEFLYRIKHLVKDYGAENVELYLFGESYDGTTPIDKVKEINNRKRMVSGSLVWRETLIKELQNIGIIKDQINDQRRVWTDKRNQTMFDPATKTIYQVQHH